MSLYLVKHHETKAREGVELCFHAFLTKALDGSECPV